MGTATVHPSQRRVSCEACRKHKSRCQRLNRYDPKCARCTLLDVECNTGQQKTIGRPRRTATSTSPSSSTTRDPTANLYTHTSLPRTSQETALLSEESCQMDWTSPMAASSSQVQLSNRSADDTFGGAAATWSIFGLGSFDQYSPPLDAPFGLVDSELMLAHDSAFSIPALSPHTAAFYPPQSPPSAASSDYGACLTTIHTLGTPGPEDVDIIDTPTALMELSKINLELYTRVAAAEMNKASLDFNNVIYRQGALCINDISLAEFMLGTSQDYLKLLNRLLSTRQSRGLLRDSPTADAPFPEQLSMQRQSQQTSQVSISCYSPPSYPADITELLPVPVALAITSIFAQLISLYELILAYITARVERISIEPIAPIPGIVLGSTPLEDSSTQGVLFSEAIVHLLEGIECALGIKPGPGNRQIPLFSARQRKVLMSELDSRRAVIPSQGTIRPADLRRLFGKVAVIFRQMSADL